MGAHPPATATGAATISALRWGQLPCSCSFRDVRLACIGLPRRVGRTSTSDGICQMAAPSRALAVRALAAIPCWWTQKLSRPLAAEQNLVIQIFRDGPRPNVCGRSRRATNKPASNWAARWKGQQARGTMDRSIVVRHRCPCTLSVEAANGARPSNSHSRRAPAHPSRVSTPAPPAEEGTGGEEVAPAGPGQAQPAPPSAQVHGQVQPATGGAAPACGLPLPLLPRTGLSDGSTTFDLGSASETRGHSGMQTGPTIPTLAALGPTVGP